MKKAFLLFILLFFTLSLFGCTQTKSGCIYNNPPCEKDYNCIDNICVKASCYKDDSICESNQTCVNDICVTPECGPGCSSEMTCVGKNQCTRFDSSTCTDGLCCVGNTCIYKKGCYYDNPSCDSNSICLNNECFSKTSVLPQNSETSKQCNNDEVFLDGNCQKASYVLVFAYHGVDRSQFDNYLNEAIPAFVQATPLKFCPNKLRVHKLQDLCCNTKIEECVEDKIGTFDSVSYIYNKETTRDSCNLAGGDKISFKTSFTCPGCDVHEQGHVFGLWDQYCYWPALENPNPVDFEEGNCKEAKEGTWHYNYCKINPETTEIVKPYVCEGNLNLFGGRTIMAGTSIFTDPAHPQFGFTKEEFESIKF